MQNIVQEKTIKDKVKNWNLYC